MTAGLLTEAAGWGAAVLLLVGYLLLSTRRIGVGRGYQTINIVGSAGLAVNGVVHGAWPSATLNLAWLAVALVGLRPRHRESTPEVEVREVKVREVEVSER
jgi:hypothetical protein